MPPLQIITSWKLPSPPPSATPRTASAFHSMGGYERGSLDGDDGFHRSFRISSKREPVRLAWRSVTSRDATAVMHAPAARHAFSRKADGGSWRARAVGLF